MLKFKYKQWPEDRTQVISNHKTGGGFWFNGMAASIEPLRIPLGDVISSSVLGNCKAAAHPMTREMYEWCLETFGEEWDNWHLKLIVNEPGTRLIPMPFRDVNVEVFFVEPKDLAIFKLRWHG